MSLTSHPSSRQHSPVIGQHPQLLNDGYTQILLSLKKTVKANGIYLK